MNPKKLAREGLLSTQVPPLAECPFPESPIQLLIQLPIGELRGALFIENQMSFEQAARSGSARLDGIALAYTSGFRGSTPRLRSAWGASVYYSPRGAVSTEYREVFESWLYAEAEGLPRVLLGRPGLVGYGNPESHADVVSEIAGLARRLQLDAPKPVGRPRPCPQ